MAQGYTPNLHLPQYVRDDKPNWLGETNEAYLSIDTGFGQVKTDAATAISASSGAVASADDAVAKVNALSGQLALMQQSLAQLEADVVNSKYINTFTPQITPNPDWDVAVENAYYNGYMGHMRILLTPKPAKTFNGELTVGVLSELPFVFQGFTTFSSIVPFITGYTAQGDTVKGVLIITINSAREIKVYLGSSNFTSPSPGAVNTITADFNFLITRTSGARALDMPENCAALI